jgi:hypothetical protein
MAGNCGALPRGLGVSGGEWWRVTEVYVSRCKRGLPATLGGTYNAQCVTPQAFGPRPFQRRNHELLQASKPERLPWADRDRPRRQATPSGSARGHGPKRPPMTEKPKERERAD